MKFKVSAKDGQTTLAIAGQLDALTSPDLRAEIDSIVESRPTRVEVDLSSLRLIDSSGVGALVSLYKRARAEGSRVEITGLRARDLPSTAARWRPGRRRRQAAGRTEASEITRLISGPPRESNNGLVSSNQDPTSGMRQITQLSCRSPF